MVFNGIWYSEQPDKINGKPFYFPCMFTGGSIDSLNLKKKTNNPDMPLSEFEIKRVEKIVSQYCENKVPPHVRDQLQTTYKIIKNEVWIYEKRPIWNNPSKRGEFPVAKAKFTLKTKLWTLYWQDRNLRWHIYDRIEPSKQLEDIIKEIDNDPTGIFWG